MPKVSIQAFDGLSPRTSPTLLSDSMGQQADNVKLYARELRYWRAPLLAYAPAMTNVNTIYRLYGSVSDVWLTWQEDVDVAPAPEADTSDFRLYYTGQATPRKTNWTLASSAAPYPTAYREMGVPAPTAAPTVAAAAGASATAESRAYVYTHVTTFGSVKEESAPSPAGNVTITTSQSVNVSGFSAVPAGAYNITHRRIYRSVTGASATAYEFVVEIPVATTTYNDNLLVAALGEDLKTLGWVPPPTDLRGLVSHPSGALAGFVNNTVYFSEPFFAHAWPLKYALSIPYKIIGLGVFATSIVVMTERYPYVITGPYPGAMSVERLPILEPCVSKGSIVSDEAGVTYASNNGLVSIGPGSQGLVTTGIFRRDEWQTQLPDLIKAGVYDEKYIAVYPNLVPGKAMVISKDDVPALSYTDLPATAVHVDSRESNLYFASAADGAIYQLDADDEHLLNYAWKSKRFVLPQATSFSALKLDADYAQITGDANYQAELDAVLAANAAAFTTGLLGGFNESLINAYPINGDALTPLPTPTDFHFVQVQLYNEGVLQTVLSLTNFNPIRIPPFKTRALEIGIVGNVSVRGISLATSVAELHGG